MRDGCLSPCYIEQIATAVPAAVLERTDSVDLFRHACRSERTAKLLSRISRFSGVERRFLAALDPRFAPDGPQPLYGPASEQPNGPGMGARNALFDVVSGELVQRALAQFDASRLAEVRTLVTVSCTHASAPGLERPILAHSAVQPDADRWNLGFMGCSAALAAIRMVSQMGPARQPALIVACELSSLHFQYSDRIDQITANLLFSDGLAAATLSERPAPARIVAARCAGLPQFADQMVWFADDHGLRLHLSQDLPDTLGAHIREAVARFLDGFGLGLTDVQHWLVHPGGPQILESVAKALELPADALSLSRGVLRRYGNMSSPTILFILRELLAARAAGRCLAMAFGPGLTVEFVLLEIDPSRPCFSSR